MPTKTKKKPVEKPVEAVGAPLALVAEKPAKPAKKKVSKPAKTSGERSATDDDVNKAATQLRSGATLATVANDLGCSYRTLQKKLKQVLGVEYVTLMVRKGKKHDNQTEGAKA